MGREAAEQQLIFVSSCFMIDEDSVGKTMKKENVNSAFCGESTAGNSFTHFNSFHYGRSPKDSELNSPCNTRRNSKENFTKVLFNERPSSFKLVLNRQQSADLDEIDRHFSMEESKSNRVSGEKSNAQRNKKKRHTESRDSSMQMSSKENFQLGVAINAESFKNPLPYQDFIFPKLTEKIIKQKETISQLMQFTPGVESSFLKNKNVQSNEADDKQEQNQKMKTVKNKTFNGVEKDQRKNLLSVTKNDFDFPSHKQTGSIFLETVNKDSLQTNQAHTLGNMLVISESNNNVISHSRLLFNSVKKEEEPLDLEKVLKSIFFSGIIGAFIALACYSYKNEYLFTFVCSGIYGESYAFLLITLISQHPFFKITTQVAADFFTIPKCSYIGFVFCLSSLFGYQFRINPSEYSQSHLIEFNTLPFLVILIFTLFMFCISSSQPFLFKRLKLNFGRKSEKEITLSESKAFQKKNTHSKGMAQAYLPHNLNNFLPDQQGPKIKSTRFIIALMTVISLFHLQVLYSFNQYEIWKSRILSNEIFVYLMVVVYLIISEIMAGIIYKIDSFFMLEFKYELEFVRGLFSASLFRLFYLMLANQRYSLILPPIKIIFKIIFFYIYPTHYENIKNCLRKSVLIAFHFQQAEFKEMQRRLFTKRLGIIQFTDFLSLLAFSSILAVLRMATREDTGKNINDFQRFTNNEIKVIAGTCLLEVTLEIITTLLIIHQLKKNPRFNELSLKGILLEVNHFLKEGQVITFIAFFSVYSAFVVSISNDHISFTGDYSLFPN